MSFSKFILKHWYAFLSIICLLPLSFSCNSTPETPRILVFTKTAGYYHASIPKGIAAIQKLGKENGFLVDTTKNGDYFQEDSLKKYKAVIFLSTTGDVLTHPQQSAFERYIQAGGGYMGIHAAADTEYEWPWYNKLVGAYFLSHPNDPNVRKATIKVVDSTHEATDGLPALWERSDEWYNYKSIYPELHVLAKLDESTYEGGTNGANHPISWYHEFDGGRAFYTGGGHTEESFSEPLFLKHLLGGIQYAIGKNTSLDYSKAHSMLPPEENRFTKQTLSYDLNEPMELAVAPDGTVFFIERAGKFYKYDPIAETTTLLYDFPVKAVDKYLNGLLGMTIDPEFAKNNFLYFFYTALEEGQHKQRVSRFVFSNGALDLESEKVLIEIPIDLEVSAHTGGSLAWDNDGNLFISTGDNTVPFESEGYAPIDEQAGRLTFDAQRSAGNPNDLRGKILRIHPEADGSYTVPAGNLFPKGTPGTRPEIYVMGCRNPYRISVDPATAIVYWGEVGPDAGKDGAQGPRGYDEINQAKKAGNYGWPYFVGDNKAYHDYNFATKEVGPLFDAKAPVNNSALNTGADTLPPAQPAMIWYPYNRSEEFPQLGESGRCAMAGPVYHYNTASRSRVKLPEYYDKALFIYDWMRNWVFAVRLDEQQNYQSMEPFMPVSGDFRRPVDMEVGPDGAIYMLEYGSVYGIDNEDARLVRITFNAGNRSPVASITANDTIGTAPLKVSFTSNESFDLDKDNLLYKWQFEEGQTALTRAEATYTFEKNGVYNAILTVTDPSGESDKDTLQIVVGNTLPRITISSPNNKTFYFDKASFNYEVKVKDDEDQEINQDRLNIAFNFIPGMKEAPTVGHQVIAFNAGKALMESSDCKACHQIDKEAVGPAFMEVSKRYSGDKNAVTYLANKIIKGGGGVWGDRAMNAHPQLSTEEATEMVKYVLSLNNKEVNSLPATGTLQFTEHSNSKKEGRYVLSASYTDEGKGSAPLTNTEVLILRPARVQAEEADAYKEATVSNNFLRNLKHNSYFVLKNIDLTGIKNLTYRYGWSNQDATIEVHANSPDGPVVSTLQYKALGENEKFKEVSTPIKALENPSDLYFVVKKESEPNENLIALDWIQFNP